MKVFISHISEESELAKVIKVWIEDAYVGQVQVFVSSDKESIQLGDKWLEKIEESLDQAKILIILCSPSSIQRPWINFEAGCGWIKKIPILPICHSGLTKSALPSPLSSFQAVELNTTSFCSNLMSAISKQLSIPKVPKIDYSQMGKEISKALSSPKKILPVERFDIHQKALIDEVMEKILLFLAKDPDNSHPSREIASVFGIAQARIEHYLDKLEALKFTGAQHYMGAPPEYYISKNGKAYLVEKDLI